MAGFDAAWAAVDHAKDGEPASSELRPLLRRVYSDVLAVPTNFPALSPKAAVLPSLLLATGLLTPSTGFPTTALRSQR